MSKNKRYQSREDWPTRALKLQMFYPAIYQRMLDTRRINWHSLFANRVEYIEVLMELEVWPRPSQPSLGGKVYRVELLGHAVVAREKENERVRRVECSEA